MEATIYYNQKDITSYRYNAWGIHEESNYVLTDVDETTLKCLEFIRNNNPFRYKGYYYDVETQLFYCNSRYYSPELCRWISPDSIEYLDPESINGLNLYCYCMNNPIMYSDPSGHIAITALLIGMAIGFGAGAVIGGGFEIAKQAYNGGEWNWDLSSWDWGQIGLSALGGGVAGAISSISLGNGFAGYLSAFALGGIGSFAGGLISGSVTDLQSAAIAFGIGAIANVAAKGIADLINKGVTAGAQKALNSPIFDGLQLDDLIGSGLKNNGLNPLYNKILNQGAKYVVNANGLWVKSALYSFTSSGLSSLFSGWY